MKYNILVFRENHEHNKENKVRISFLLLEKKLSPKENLGRTSLFVMRGKMIFFFLNNFKVEKQRTGEKTNS